jgi:uncharacterized membrane protein YhaH (DUF805 family)
MNAGESIASVMGKYATFSGRASRSEYWWFILFGIALSWGATVVDASQGVDGLLAGIVSLALLVPQIAVGCRRLHDVGKSGWWQLIALTIIGIIPLIVWYSTESNKGDNVYGPKPIK